MAKEVFTVFLLITSWTGLRSVHFIQVKNHYSEFQEGRHTTKTILDKFQQRQQTGKFPKSSYTSVPKYKPFKKAK
jgi:hypothetical protein